MMPFFIVSCGSSSSNPGPDPVNDDASLKGITLGNADLDIDSGITLSTGTVTYEKSVAFAVNKVRVRFVTNDTAASISLNGKPAISDRYDEVDLTVGLNIITATITAADGDTAKSYIFRVTRAVASTADATLKSLILKNIALSPIFTSDITSYTANVGYLMTTLTLSPVANNDGASIIVNGVSVTSGSDSAPIPLIIGVNTVTVTVTAVDDTNKNYTLTVIRADEQSFAQQAYLKASNAESGEQFGYSVALDGDTMVVGAPRDIDIQQLNPPIQAGAVYVFTRDASVNVNGGWVEQNVLKSSNVGAGDLFGHSVALKGNTIVVGAPGESSIGTVDGESDPSDNSAYNAGAVYVFTRDVTEQGTTWVEQAYLKARNADSDDLFGHSVALDEDESMLVVGAIGESSLGFVGDLINPPDNAGAVYVFTLDDTWGQTVNLKADNTKAGDNFGHSVALGGDTLVVGAPFEDTNGADSGAVYVFTRAVPVESTEWNQTAYLKAVITGENDQFGHSLALDGDTLVVGAPFDDNNEADSGAVYIFTRAVPVESTEWNQTAYLKAVIALENDQFGHSVAVDGNTLVVGAPFVSSNPVANVGGVSVFTRVDSTWSEQATLTASNAEAGDLFGHSVVVDGDTVVVGALGEDSDGVVDDGENIEEDNDAPDAGAVYVW
jgi:hypothetical protein